MAAEEFVLIPKHMYIRDQPHAAHILLDNSIKHKKPQLSYLNRLRPLNESARTTTTSAFDKSAVIPPTPEPPIVAKAENNPQKQALPLTSQDDDDDDGDGDDDDDEGNEMEKSVELSEALSTERILLQLQLMDEHKFKRAKKVLEVIKKSERVKINKDNEEIYVDKVPTGLKASVFLYDIQQQTKKLYNPAFILILRSLKLDERLVMNKYAKVAVQSTNTEQAQQKQRSRRSTNSPSKSTALLLLSPEKKPSSSSSTTSRRDTSKSSKRRKTRKTVADSERERSPQKTKREEEGAAEEEYSESYETPDNDSDSATTEKKKTKTNKKWQDYTS
ncbi:protein DEK-like [Symsagittifera roscoffensis]|uniref:protein DEK-like n=1 Tax=Symsagittifera roscoffensis TaxID=84072 RepID=UPI00307B1E68